MPLVSFSTPKGVISVLALTQRQDKRKPLISLPFPEGWKFREPVFARRVISPSKLDAPVALFPSGNRLFEN